MGTVERVAHVALEVGALLGEGPVWDSADRTLVFVDIESGLVHRYDPSSGRSASFATDGTVGAVGLRTDGGLVLALRDAFGLSGPAGEGFAEIGGFRVDGHVVRFNDAEVDPWGRFVAGTMHRGKSEPVGTLYRLGTAGEVEALVPGVTISNGLAWTVDRRRLYYVDTPTGVVDAFDVDPDDGTMTGRRAAIVVDPGHGMPDGIALDTEGCLWVACYGGGRVCRFTPEGRLDAIVRVPVSCVTSIAFGGPDLDTLYVTTARTDLDEAGRAREVHAGDLFAVDTDVTGMAPSRYGPGAM